MKKLVVVLVCMTMTSCTTKDEPISKETSDALQQGAPPGKRTFTADTDRDQLRAFYFASEPDSPIETQLVVQGPFVLQGVSPSFGSLFLNTDGICPSYDDVNTDQVTNHVLNSINFSVVNTSFFVPPGTALCVITGSGYGVPTTFVSGFVPYP